MINFIEEAGPYGHSGESIVACMKAGFYAVSTETICDTDGKSPDWNLHIWNNSIINCSKWSDIPLERWSDYEIPYAVSNGARVIASVGHNEKSISGIIPVLNKTDIMAYKIVSYSAKDVIPMLKAAKELTDKPVIVKISSNWGEEAFEIACKAQKYRADAIVAIDSVGPVYDGKLKGNDHIGWMSGECILPRALYYVHRLKEFIKIPIIGTGGVTDGISAMKMADAGADAIGICTGTILKGPEIISEIKEYLTENITDCDNKKFNLKIDRNRCKHCGECIKHCGYMAIKYTPKGCYIDETKCRHCGLCMETCPNGAVNN